MPRKSPSRLDMRRQVEAADARGDAAEAAPTKKKAAAKKGTTTRAKRTKEKAVARKRLVWVVFNGAMKEEGRFPYDQKTEAEERLEALRQKSKKLYWLQPVKELLGEPTSAVSAAPADFDDDDAVAVVPEVAEDEDEEFEEEEEDEEEDDDDDDDE
jgi:hypothetical protein